MKLQYPVLIEKGDSETAWGGIVPDLPGCFSAADSEEELLDNIREAILLHLDGEDEIPQPSSIVDVAQRGFFAVLVDVELQVQSLKDA